MVLGIVELVQAFCRTGGGQSGSRMVDTNLECRPTPCKIGETNTATPHYCANGAQ
jgi:hypothetical protein